MKVPASPLLRIVIENCLTRQFELIKQLKDTQDLIQKAVDTEALGLGKPIDSFNTDTLEFDVMDIEPVILPEPNSE